MQSPPRGPAVAPPLTPLPLLPIPDKNPLWPAVKGPSIDAVEDAELAAFLRHRRHICGIPAGDSGRRDGLRAYLRSLDALVPRYAVALERSRLSSLAFAWSDAMAGGSRRTHTASSLAAERAAALFALAAAESRAAVAEERGGSVDGIRRAACALQNAAGALAAARGWEAAVDMSEECVAAMETLMVAQANECYFQMAVAVGKSPELCSKISRQVGLGYEEVLATLSSPQLKHHIDRKKKLRHVQVKAAYFHAEASYRYSQALHGKQEIGEEIARLKRGLDGLDGAKKPLKKVAGALQDAVKRLQREMKGSLQRAEKENAQIYCMRVPAADLLPDLPAVFPAKPTPAAGILESG